MATSDGGSRIPLVILSPPDRCNNYVRSGKHAEPNTHAGRDIQVKVLKALIHELLSHQERA